MGKLHSLRRAIERNPGIWHENGRAMAASRTGPVPYISRLNRQTVRYEKFYIGPYTFYPVDGFWTGRYPYRRFVRKVLRELGALKS